MEMSRKSLVSGNCPLCASSVGLHQYLVGCCGPCVVPGIIFNVLTHFEHLCNDICGILAARSKIYA